MKDIDQVVSMVKVEGRATIAIKQQPTAANGYTLIVGAFEKLSVARPDPPQTRAVRGTCCVTPGVDSDESSPPISATIRWLIASPTPVPLPLGFVVKNGSKMRPACSGATPRHALCRTPPPAHRRPAKAGRRRTAGSWNARSEASPRAHSPGDVDRADADADVVDAGKREEVAHDRSDAVDVLERDGQRSAALLGSFAERGEVANDYLDVVENGAERLVHVGPNKCALAAVVTAARLVQRITPRR